MAHLHQNLAFSPISASTVRTKMSESRKKHNIKLLGYQFLKHIIWTKKTWFKN